MPRRGRLSGELFRDRTGEGLDIVVAEPLFGERCDKRCKMSGDEWIVQEIGMSFGTATVG